MQGTDALALTKSGTNGIDHATRKEATVVRYGARYWAVYLDADLLAVTVYALAIQAVLSQVSSPKGK